MKFSSAILIALAHSAPGPSLEDLDYYPERGVFDTICSTLDEEFIIVTHVSNNDNGQSGKLTMDKRSGYLDSCGEPIGQQCKKGVKFNWFMSFPTGLVGGHTHSPYWMTANYNQYGEFKRTEQYYGNNPFYAEYNPPSNEFELIDAYDVTMFMFMNKVPYYQHAKAIIEWECLDFNPDFPMSNKWATNTWQMAQAVLTEDFTPQMAENYGCAGRGLFDAFSSTSPIVNDIDAAFLTWKKCVKCAAGEDKTKVVPYYYDATIDSCGAYITKGTRLTNKTSYLNLISDSEQDFCECDRALMKVLKNAPADTGYSMYPQEDCYIGHKTMYVPLTCCKWDENFWAAYNPSKMCCGPDGVREIGMC